MNSLLGKFVSTLISPWSAMKAVKEEEGTSLKSYMVFVVVMGLVSGIIAAVWGFIVPPPAIGGAAVGKGSVLLAIPVIPIVSFLLSFVGTFILWGLVHGFLKGSMGEYKTLYRMFALMAAFSPINSLLAPIPVVGQYLGIALNLWGIIVLIRGIIIVVETPTVRSWVVLGFIFVALFLLGLMSRQIFQQQLQQGGPAFSDLGGAGLDENITANDEDALNRELQSLADKEKADMKRETPPEIKK